MDMGFALGVGQNWKKSSIKLLKEFEWNFFIFFFSSKAEAILLCSIGRNIYSFLTHDPEIFNASLKKWTLERLRWWIITSNRVLFFWCYSQLLLILNKYIFLGKKGSWGVGACRNVSCYTTLGFVSRWASWRETKTHRWAGGVHPKARSFEPHIYNYTHHIYFI